MTEKKGATTARSRSTATDVVLAVVGFVVGGFLAMVLVYVLWPGGATAGLLIDSPSAPAAPEEIRHAALMYGAMLGLLGAIIPAAGYRIGYTVAALIVVIVGQSQYWTTHDLGVPLLVAVGVWLVVAGGIRLIAQHVQVPSARSQAGRRLLPPKRRPGSRRPPTPHRV